MPANRDYDTFMLARFDADGQLDTTFGAGGVWEQRIGSGWNELTDITIAPNGDIWASGIACDGAGFSGQTDSNGTYRTGWMRNLPNGTYFANVQDLALAGCVWNPLTLDLEDDSDNDGRPDDGLYI